MAYSIIKHNGKDVLFINHRGLNGDDLYASIKEVNEFLAKNKKVYPAVVDFSDTTGSKMVSDYLQSEETKSVAPYIPQQAVVGMTGIKKVALRLYNAFTGVKTGVFDTIEEALDYITKL